ncbi:TonB-dependent receptor domain-containing protein [Sphingomonas sp. MMS24-JH45]
MTGQARATTRNIAIYAFDTLELGRAFEINGGLRWEYQHATFRTLPLSVVPPGSTQVAAAAQVPQDSRERLFSYRIGGVFHPVQDVSLYASYGNARTPSSQTVRLGCAAGSGGIFVISQCDVAPETAKKYEAGVKAGVSAAGWN